MNDSDTFFVNWPGRIVFGAGRLASLAEECKPLGGRHVLVVTTEDLVRLGVVERAEQILRDAGFTTTRFAGVKDSPVNGTSAPVFRLMSDS